MSIVQNKKATHDYFIEERFEAGLALEGWEIKAIRAGRVQLKEGYVVIRDAELYLIGAHITPLPDASTHVKPDPLRSRKLLMHAGGIATLLGTGGRAGCAPVPVGRHCSKGRVKARIGPAEGKRQYDKRATEREREWPRARQRITETNVKGKG